MFCIMKVHMYFFLGVTADGKPLTEQEIQQGNWNLHFFYHSKGYHCIYRYLYISKNLVSTSVQ